MSNEITRLKGHVEKGWGHELIFATTDKYCGKLLTFKEKGSKFSMHFHREKDETWFVMSGMFEVHWIDTTNADVTITTLKTGDVFHIEPLVPHQIVCVEPGTIIEVSTADSVEDNYRVAPGDSQK